MLGMTYFLGGGGGGGADFPTTPVHFTNMYYYDCRCAFAAGECHVTNMPQSYACDARSLFAQSCDKSSARLGHSQSILP